MRSAATPAFAPESDFVPISFGDDLSTQYEDSPVSLLSPAVALSSSKSSIQKFQRDLSVDHIPTPLDNSPQSSLRSPTFSYAPSPVVSSNSSWTKRALPRTPPSPYGSSDNTVSRSASNAFSPQPASSPSIEAHSSSPSRLFSRPPASSSFNRTVYSETPTLGQNSHVIRVRLNDVVDGKLLGGGEPWSAVKVHLGLPEYSSDSGWSDISELKLAYDRRGVGYCSQDCAVLDHTQLSFGSGAREKDDSPDHYQDVISDHGTIKTPSAPTSNTVHQLSQSCSEEDTDLPQEVLLSTLNSPLKLPSLDTSLSVPTDGHVSILDSDVFSEHPDCLARDNSRPELSERASGGPQPSPSPRPLTRYPSSLQKPRALDQFSMFSFLRIDASSSSGSGSSASSETESNAMLHSAPTSTSGRSDGVTVLAAPELESAVKGLSLFSDEEDESDGSIDD